MVVVLEIYYYGKKNLDFHSFVQLFRAFKVIGSQTKFHPTLDEETCEFCFIITSFYFKFSFLALLILRLLAKRIALVLSSPKCMLNLLSTNQLQTFSRSLFSCFPFSSTPLCWYIRHESWRYKNRFDFTVCGMSLA